MTSIILGEPMSSYFNHRASIGRSPRATRAAFTLIELLVAIAIISLLAAILFPVFSRARENSRRTACQSNLKQLATAVQQYAQDNNEYYVLSSVAPTVTPTNGVPAGWADAILPYSKSTQLYQCPSEGFAAVNAPQNGGYTDYWLSKPLGDGAANVTVAARPSVSIMMGDGGTNNGTAVNGNASARYRTNGCNANGDPTNANVLDISVPGCASGGIVTNFGGGGLRHLGGVNLAFVDGHVKWYSNFGANSTGSRIYNGATPFSTSGSSPTFRLKE